MKNRKSNTYDYNDNEDEPQTQFSKEIREVLETCTKPQKTFIHGLKRKLLPQSNPEVIAGESTIEICWSKALHVVLSGNAVTVTYEYDTAAKKSFEITDKDLLPYILQWVKTEQERKDQLWRKTQEYTGETGTEEDLEWLASIKEHWMSDREMLKPANPEEFEAYATLLEY